MGATNYEVERDGFALVKQGVSSEQRANLLAALGEVARAGTRGLLTRPEVVGFARSLSLLATLRPHLLAEPRPVRAIFFDKVPGARWLVTWHQDVTLALCEKIEIPGFGPWSVKDGIVHVQPPADLLARMLTVRVHLDDADEENGALRVLAGTHRRGRLSADEISDARAARADVVCRAVAGDVLLMRPLLLHASGRSTSPDRHRRVLHIEYAGFDLPGGLRWNEGA